MKLNEFRISDVYVSDYTTFNHLYISKNFRVTIKPTTEISNKYTVLFLMSYDVQDISVKLEQMSREIIMILYQIYIFEYADTRNEEMNQIIDKKVLVIHHGFG